MPTNMSKKRAAEGRTAAFLVAPTFIILAVVVLWPTLSALWQSLFGQPGFNSKTGFMETKEPFVGLSNYAHIFSGSAGQRFVTALVNTTEFTVITVAIETVLGVAMALIMNQAMKGKGLIRAAILIPWAIPTAVSGVLWKWIFDAHGIANVLLGTQILWATGDWSAKFAVIIADTWKTAPFIGLLTLAGLQIIPDEVYEAAKLDGTTAWKRFTAITLPLIKPALVVAILFRMLDALRMFDLPFILIGPRKSSVETLSMLVQNEATNLRYGMAAAYAVVLFIYVFLVVWAFVKIVGADVMGTGNSREGHQHKTRASLFFKRQPKPALTPEQQFVENEAVAAATTDVADLEEGARHE
ncbi:MAG: sugar ABC transporter permease [Actinomycetaceae bacterium]|nr:sugar ABC transporter permease [Actinomycetaceae bacterium]MDU0969837.1 sugar ABC transporter permease [Actinomycetaceae bacterium]